MTTTFEMPDVLNDVASALAEDLGMPRDAFLPNAWPDPGILNADVTTSAVIAEGECFSGVMVARVDAVVCGLPLVREVYETLSRAAGLEEPVEVFPLVAEGAAVVAGTRIAEVSGDARAVLAGERTALDFVMTLSGIATQARRWREAAPEALTVLDTRKTLPGLRALSKYAVVVGGAENHREGLWDMVLVKDNHIRRAGGIEAAVLKARALHPELLVEVEADTIEQAEEASRVGADIVLLDNMDDLTLERAVRVVREAAGDRRVLTEASGRVAIDRLSALASAGVDRVSTSALAFARPLDFALDEAT